MSVSPLFRPEPTPEVPQGPGEKRMNHKYGDTTRRAPLMWGWLLWVMQWAASPRRLVSPRHLTPFSWKLHQQQSGEYGRTHSQGTCIRLTGPGEKSNCCWGHCQVKFHEGRQEPLINPRIPSTCVSRDERSKYQKLALKLSLLWHRGTLGGESKKPNMLENRPQRGWWMKVIVEGLPCIADSLYPKPTGHSSVMRVPWRRKPRVVPAHMCPHYTKVAQPSSYGGDKGQVNETRRPRSWCQLCISQLWCLRNVTPEPPCLLLTSKMTELNSDGPLPRKNPFTSQRRGVLLALQAWRTGLSVILIQIQLDRPQSSQPPGKTQQWARAERVTETFTI